MTSYHQSYARFVIDKHTKQKTIENSRAIENSDERIQNLEAKFEELALLTDSLWQLLKQESDLKDSDLAEKIKYTYEKNKIESRLKVECPSCSRQLPIKESVCYYCGYDIQANS